MSDAESVSKRIKALMQKNGLTREELASLIGVNVSTVSSWMVQSKNRRNVRDTNLYQLAKTFHVTYDYLKYGTVSSLDDSTVTFISEYAFPFGCGTTSEPDYSDLETRQYVPYAKKYFENKGIKASDCKIFKVHGDSMSPYILDGDRVLVECVDATYITDKGIYALILKDGLSVKQLIHNSLKHTIEIRSLNTEYETVTLSESEFQENVVHCWRVIKISREFIK